mgnify:CR=1 FL=1
MITPNREEVIENIKKALADGRFNDKVEVGDPVFDAKKRKKVLRKFLRSRKSLSFKFRNFAALRVYDLYTAKRNQNTLIEGLEKIKDIKGGAIITSNHFNPDENSVIRYLGQKVKKGRVFIVLQDTNLGMTGLFGFFMNNVDSIPISPDVEYTKKYFDKLLGKALKKKRYVLIYPEQEMWFNYRKPRPPKRGPYFFAANHKVPVISCFVEIRELPKLEADNFHETQYVLHVLDPIYPDPDKNARENSIEMAKKDYAQKVEAYEKAYGKKLTYDFEQWDIAGWDPGAVKEN